ncbi:uncharacterized protein LOC123577694 [Leopardus geoffroyi]|uniref:uncharacterized protein LOC123577694 n=1 Tax=Leopardus geoffroyi TaxID=46844 RepID=UPI001E26000B|nr:uncharacterized protein LOC123577694 [Leopardus geoffroyi]
MSASKRGRHRAHVSPPARAGNDQLLGQVEQGSAFQAVGRAGAEALRQRLAPGRNGPAEGRKTKWGGGSSRRERKGLPVDEAGRKVGLAGRGPWEDKGSRGSWQAGETWRAWLTPVRLRWPGRDRPCSVESLQVLKDAFRNRLARLADFSLAATCSSCLFSLPSSLLLRGSERKGRPSCASRVLPLSLFARCCFPVVAQMRKQRR